MTGIRKKLRVLFLNEALGGHTTVHHNLRLELSNHPDIEPVFVDVPTAGLPRRVVGAALPILGPLDADLQPVRAQYAAAAVARNLLKQHAPTVDVCHVYTANAGLLATDLLRQHPSVVTTDTTNVHNVKRLPYREPTWATPVNLAAVKGRERAVYRVCDKVVANSDWAAESMRRDYGIANDHIRLIRFGITAPDFVTPAPGPAVTGPASPLPKVTFVGRQLERKGALRLLRIHQEHFRDECELVLVTTEAVTPAPNVTVISDVRPGDGRIWDALRESAVFAFPSDIDQAPNAVLEAMGAGVPVIAVNIAAQAEMVQPGTTGLLIEPTDDEGLRRSLRRLLDNPEERVRMGAAGRQRMLEHYDMARSTAALVDLFHEVAASSPKVGAR